MFHRRVCTFATILCALGINLAQGQNQREIAVRGDREKIAGDSSWIYNDLDKGREAARAEGKPLLVVIRCVP